MVIPFLAPAAPTLRDSTKAGQLQAYTWDGLGRQVSRSQTGARTDFWFDASGMTLESGASSRTYLRDPAGLPLSVSNGATTSNLGRDRLGSIIALTSAAQGLAASLSYDAWGQTLASSGNHADSNLRFSGARRDPTSGYYQLGVRSYWWNLGRFTQPDPYPDNLLGPSRYAYAGCNPTNNVDPTGLQACVPVVIGTALALQGLAFTSVALGIGAVAAAPILIVEPVILVAEAASLFATAFVLDALVQAATRPCEEIDVDLNPLTFG